MKQKMEGLFGVGWPMVWWLLGSLCIPITLPWFLYNFIEAWKAKQLRNKLQGKVVLVTGASSGLGEALAHEFYRAGCRVILASRRQKELERVRTNLLNSYKTEPAHPPVILPLDLVDLNSIPECVNKILDIHGHVDILVNNAGISHRGDVITTKVDVDIKVMLVNYFGQVALTKAVLPSMIKRGSGHVIAVSSIQGKIAIPQRSAYAASKHALQAFCDTLRAEVAHHNVKVSVVTVGYINTNLSLNAVTGTGQIYGVMDATTASGYDPKYVAKEMLKVILLEKKEVTIAPLSPRLAIVLRTLAPEIFFWVMEKRARKPGYEPIGSDPEQDKIDKINKLL
uniref:Dehydrogenase/reductase SDR family protein 7-like n=1 Tax=Timema shepardi TaxID=629360 RepID=A0A7R9G1T9_TIMSH|nr:unnamed protein product [Timema shepardi]